MNPTAPAWLIWAFLAAVFAAATAITAKAGMRDFDSDAGTLIRTGVVLLFAVAILTARGKLSVLTEITSRQGSLLVLSGLATGASWLCYFRALQLGNASQVAVVDKLSVVLVAIAATLFLGERLSPSGWGGVVMVGVGAYLVARQ